jgi:hypothetical protein
MYIPVFFLEETHTKIIMERRALKEENNQTHTKPPASTLLFGILFITLLRPTNMLLTEPIVILFSIYAAFNFAFLFTFFVSVPYVFEVVYSFDLGQTGLVFLAIGLGCTLAVPMVILLDRMIYMKEYMKPSGLVEPEVRLWGAMVGAFRLPIGLFWYA